MKAEKADAEALRQLLGVPVYKNGQIFYFGEGSVGKVLARLRSLKARADQLDALDNAMGEMP